MFWAWCYFAYIHCPIARHFEERSTPLYLQSGADGPGVSTTPGQTDKPQSSSNTVMVAGVAVPVVVLVFAAVC